MAGEADWLAFELPTEGTAAGKPRAGDVARREAPTCGLTDRVADVSQRIRTTDWDSSVVVNDDDVVLGRVRADPLNDEGGETAEAIMEAGPTTVRPSEYLEKLVPRMQKQDVAAIIVASSDGRFIGVLRREDAEQRLAEQDKS